MESREGVLRVRLGALRARQGQKKPTDLRSAAPSAHEAAVFRESTTASESTVRVAILLVDDHELLARSVAVALSLDAELTVVGIETNPDTSLMRVVSRAPDVVILDRLTLVARLREEHPRARLLALGPAEDQNLVLDCIRAGVDGCVNMNTSPAALSEVIKRVHDGEPVYETRALLDLLHRPQSSFVSPPRRTASLAKRELDVLSVTAMGLTTAESADYLGISVNTFRTHLKNILAKLDARSKLEAVLIAIREGRIEVPDDPG